MYHRISVTLGDGTVKEVRVRGGLWKTLEPGGQPVIISHGQLGHTDTTHAGTGHPDAGHPRLMTAGHATAVAEAGGLIGAWTC